MLRKDVIRIRSIAPVTKERTQEREMKQKGEWAARGVTIETVALPEGPSVLESEYHAAQAGWPLLREVAKAEADGVDAIIIDCFADPMIDACREATSLPIIGPGQAGIMSALCLGDRIGIISPNERGTGFIRRNMAKYGVKARVSYWGEVLPGSSNIHENPDKTRDALLTACEKAAASSECDVILLGCTALEPYWEDIKDTVKIPIPVIEPFPCAVKLAELFVTLGVSQSQHCYPREESRPGCDR